MIGRARSSIGTAQKQNSQVARYRAPIGGVDLRKSLGDLEDPIHCIYTYNMMPFELGMRVREGYREWALDVDAGANSGIHTLIPFDSAEENNVGDKLFAVNNEGIWDATAYDTAPTQLVTFPDQDIDAGYGTFTHYVDQAENDVLFYADNVNGLYSYSGGVWTNTGLVDGIEEVDVKFVMSHKNNIWFAVKNSTVGYYLDILSTTGTVTPQYFGDKFKHGGTLEGLFSWTVDGGSGVDDILVAVSHAGDVIMYTGSGPEADDWGMKGIWYIGEIPNTPRFGTEQGGELLLLSSYGIVSMNDLLKGVDTNALLAAMDGTTISAKIAAAIRSDMKAKRELRGWGVSMVPTEGGLLLETPTVGSEAPIQYYYNIATQGWGIWRGVPMKCFTQFKDSVFFGTTEGTVMRMDVSVDNQLINPISPAFNGESIDFSVLTSYRALGSAGVYKRVKFIRPDFLSTEAPLHSSQARYDFSLDEGNDFQLQVSDNITSGLWDLGRWDENVWGSDTSRTFPTLTGSWGSGRYIAVATKGTTRYRTRLLGWDVIYDTGGPMS
jgi:hypothetical protein